MRNLADANATNEKISDMKQRVAKMNSEQPDAVISIHQNSYTDSSVKGAQVFYYEGSKEGKMLAELLQKSLIDNVDPQNHRVAKANSDYYILKNTSAPTVIVECGFSQTRKKKPSDKCRVPGKLVRPCRRDLRVSGEHTKVLVGQ